MDMDFKGQGTYSVGGKTYDFLLYTDQVAVVLNTQGTVMVSCEETVQEFGRPPVERRGQTDPGVRVEQTDRQMTVTVRRHGEWVKVAEVWVKDGPVA